MQQQQAQKAVNLGLLLAALAAFVFCRQLIAAIWDVARLPLPDWPLEPSHAIGAAMAAAAAFWARKNDKANGFLNEVALELSKVTWPQRKETVASAGVVIVLVGIAAIILFVIDSIWSSTIRGLLAL